MYLLKTVKAKSFQCWFIFSLNGTHTELHHAVKHLDQFFSYFEYNGYILKHFTTNISHYNKNIILGNNNE